MFLENKYTFLVSALPYAVCGVRSFARITSKARSESERMLLAGCLAVAADADRTGRAITVVSNIARRHIVPTIRHTLS